MLNAELKDLFENPRPEFGPTPLWWWSGEKVTSERLRGQLTELVSGGIRDVVVINLAPAGPLAGTVADDPRWFSEEWWELFVDICGLAQELGARIWFYDQIGFSGANIQGSLTAANPWSNGQAIEKSEAIVEAGGGCSALNDDVVGVYSLPNERFPHGRRLEVNDRVISGASEGDTVTIVSTRSTSFDYLNPDAFSLLLDYVHGEFDRRVPQYLGGVIAGSFQDELPATNSWTPAFARLFLDRFGYDLLDELPALFAPAGDAGAKILHDYYTLRTELTEAAVFKPLGAWHDERGMLIGSDQMNPARAGYPSQGTQLYSDYMRTHRWYSAAGSDHQGDGKIHSSMAHLYGHSRTWIEAFHSSGWGASLQEIYDWLLPWFRSGANLYNPHAVYYSAVGGWFEWAPPSTDWRQPYWGQYPAFSDAVARISSIIAWGAHRCDIAVLHPTSTSQSAIPLGIHVEHESGLEEPGTGSIAADSAQRDYLQVIGLEDWFATNPGVLDRAALDFDVIDDASVQRALVDSARLTVADEAYRTVIVPSNEFLEEATATALVAFLNGGGEVVLAGALPRLAAGTRGDDSAVRRLVEHPRVKRATTVAEIPGLLDDPRRIIASPVPVLVRHRGPDGVAFVTSAFPNATGYPLRTDERRRWDDFDYDEGRYAQSFEIELGVVAESVELWDPATGRSRPAIFHAVGGRTKVTVDFAGAPALFVVWHEGAGSDVSTSPGSGTLVESGTRRSLADGWTSRLVPTMRNDWGDLARPAEVEIEKLQLWSMEWTEKTAADGATADGGWTTVRATFGPHGLVVSLLAGALAPTPLSPAAALDVVEGHAPLGDDSWTRWDYSDSRGIDHDRIHLANFGAKGMVPEEFVQVQAAHAQGGMQYRTIVRAEAGRRYLLVIGAGAPKHVWWNGEPVGSEDGAYILTATVEADRSENVLEYRLGPSDNSLMLHVDPSGDVLGSFWTLSAEDGWPQRPEFIAAPERAGRSSFRRTISIRGDIAEATAVTGAARQLTLFIDGHEVARQEKVEYYEDEWGATPRFFSHELSGYLTAGEHEIELVEDSLGAADIVYFDLLVRHADGSQVAFVSGKDWIVSQEDSSAEPTRLHQGHWGQLPFAHAASRPHPLPRAHWLAGEPQLGQRLPETQSAATTEPHRQWFRVTVPAGTSALSIPLGGPFTATIDGAPIDVKFGDGSGSIRLAEPTTEVAELLLVTEAVRFATGGAAWSGPIVVTTETAPGRFGNLGDQGLSSWSGGVAYERTITVDHSAPERILDLGSVKGTVSVRVNDEEAGHAFCSPYRFDLGEFLRDGDNTVEVTVFNTLAPYLNEVSPTLWIFPSQLVSGIFGPVALTKG